MTDLDSPDKVIMQAIEALLPILTGAVRGTVTDLLDAEYARGVAEERARVVADLRKVAEEFGRLDGGRDLSCERLGWAADRYERGEHDE